jgi:hypothetical protein
MPGIIFLVMVPATIMTSLCLAEGRKTSAPKRDMSNLAHPVAIISMAQQAIPNVRGHKEFALPILISLSTAAN